MGPGNGPVNSDVSNFVPMNDAGVAYNLFVRLDNHPGIDFITGAPITYTFRHLHTKRLYHSPLLHYHRP